MTSTSKPAPGATTMAPSSPPSRPSPTGGLTAGLDLRAAPHSTCREQAKGRSTVQHPPNRSLHGFGGLPLRRPCLPRGRIGRFHGHQRKAFWSSVWSVASSVVCPCIAAKGLVPAARNRVEETTGEAAHDVRRDHGVSQCRVGLASSVSLTAATNRQAAMGVSCFRLVP
jgi:hypothetical protein